MKEMEDAAARLVSWFLSPFPSAHVTAAVTVTVGGKRVLYDFDKATITEADGSNESTQP